MWEDKTLKYYEDHADDFTEQTVKVDFLTVQEQFLSYLAPGAHILDLGCGSGRDTRYFLERGFMTDAVDGSAAMCRYASAHTGISVRQMLFEELSDQGKYDGIWACASLLHLPEGKLTDVFVRIHAALKPGGVCYMSFKYGSFEGERNGRYFTDLTEAGFQKLAEGVEGLQTEKMWISSDARPGRNEEKWLNVILKKI